MAKLPPNNYSQIPSIRLTLPATMESHQPPSYYNYNGYRDDIPTAPGEMSCEQEQAFQQRLRRVSDPPAPVFQNGNLHSHPPQHQPVLQKRHSFPAQSFSNAPGNSNNGTGSNDAMNVQQTCAPPAWQGQEQQMKDVEMTDMILHPTQSGKAQEVVLASEMERMTFRSQS